MSIANIASRRTDVFNRKVGAKLIDLRVSCLPTNHGESIVMRILDKEGLKLGLPELGFFTDDQQTFEKLIGFAGRILLVTAPLAPARQPRCILSALYQSSDRKNHHGGRPGGIYPRRYHKPGAGRRIRGLVVQRGLCARFSARRRT